MDFLSRLSGLGAEYSRPTPTQKLWASSDLSAAVQHHLLQVYVTLAVALGLAASGVYLSALTGYGQGLGMICFMVCVPWLVSTPAQPHNTNKRRALFAGAAVGQGLLLAPLVRTTLALNPGVLAAAFAGTAGVFACFSGAALLSQRRSYLYLGGVLGSAMTAFMWMRLGSFFMGGGALLFQAELYVGLVVFSGYVVYDTQLIVEKREAGDTDALRHALDLFVDFAAIFVRLLVILLRNAEERNRQKTDERQGHRPRSMRPTRR